MAQQKAPSGHSDEPVHADPWLAFSYLVSGAAFYGLLGWVLDRWLGTTFLVVIGILLGVALGIYMTFGRFGGLASRRDQQR
jgi:F0F1-type ATP synthase assembly protein I